MLQSGQCLLCLARFGVDPQRILVGIVRLFCERQGLISPTETQIRIHIRIIQLYRHLIVLHRLLELPEIVVRRGQVKVAFGAVLVDFKGLLIGGDRFFELIQHIESITQVVESRCILRI